MFIYINKNNCNNSADYYREVKDFTRYSNLKFCALRNDGEFYISNCNTIEGQEDDT